MTEHDLRNLLDAARDLLRPHLEQSEPLRRLVHSLGKLLIDEVEHAGGAPPGIGPGANISPVSPPTFDSSLPNTSSTLTDRDGGEAGTLAASPVGRSSSGMVPLKLGDVTVQLPVRGTTEEIGRARMAGQPSPSAEDEESEREFRGIDLALIARRSRLKADSCRLYIERRSAASDMEREREVLDRMEAMIADAKSMPNCFLWAFWRERTQPDDATLETIACCYVALAEAATAMRRVDELGDAAEEGDVVRAVELLAEASCAMRIALERTWLTYPDIDQNETHHWLRHETAVRRIYVPFMRLDDRAEPERAQEVAHEARDMLTRLQDRAAHLKEIEAAFKRIQYHILQIERGIAPGALTSGTEDLGEAAEHDYLRIAQAIERLAELGVAPTDRRFHRVITLPVASAFPRELAAARPVAAALEGIVERHARDEGDDEEPMEAGREWSERVAEVRSLLRGRAVVMVGGEPRPDAIRRIKDAFELTEVIWPRLTEHGSGEPMRAPIARPETALVLVLIKLAGHLHAEEANGYAREWGKSCVFLKAGYNPEQIAEAVHQQVSAQLLAGK